METRGHKVLFECPTNKLANNYKEHGNTNNKFFCIGLTEGKAPIWPSLTTAATTP